MAKKTINERKETSHRLEMWTKDKKEWQICSAGTLKDMRRIRNKWGHSSYPYPFSSSFHSPQPTKFRVLRLTRTISIVEQNDV